jgi:hypothetical protein
MASLRVRARKSRDGKVTDYYVVRTADGAEIGAGRDEETATLILEEIRKQELLSRNGAPPASPHDKPGVVYFIQADGGAVKIGFTAKSAEGRLRSLQTGTPGSLRLLGWIKASESFERHLHARFWGWHLRGEWFEPTRGLLNFIKRTAHSGASA